MISTRRVRDYAPVDGHSTADVELTDYRSRQNVVLLGDPGAGKSHELGVWAATEGAVCLTVRDYLNEADVDPVRPLFLDGLDERRNGRGDDDVIDQLVRTLRRDKPASVRLACRAQLWSHGSDLAALRAYFGGTVSVIELRPFSQDEADAFLRLRGEADPTEFCRMARRKGVEFFLGNPQSLKMLHETVQKTAAWPKTRLELYRTATGLLLDEAEPAHSRKKGHEFTGAELRLSAGAIAAASLIADVDRIALDNVTTKSAPTFRQFLRSADDPQKVEAALYRRAFKISGRDAVEPSHRTIAEFLAAEWLVDQLRSKGLPLGRLIALIGVGGRPVSSLRALWAWISTLAPEYLDELIGADPMGFVMLGDAAALSVAHKKRVVDHFRRLAAENPGFRDRLWDTDAFGSLAHPALADEFKKLLGADQTFGLRSLAIDAIAASDQPLATADELAAIVADNDRSMFERSRAIDALGNYGADGVIALTRLLGRLAPPSTEHIRLRTDVLLELSRAGVRRPMSEVVALYMDTLSAPQDLPIGVALKLTETFDGDDARAVLDLISSQMSNSNRDRYDRGSEIRHAFEVLLPRALEGGTSPSGDQAWTWLKARKKVCRGYSSDRERCSVRSALIAQPELVRRIAHAAWHEMTSTQGTRLQMYEFESVMAGALTGDELLATLVNYIEAHRPSTKEGIDLFRWAIRLTYDGRPHALACFDRLATLAENEEAYAAAYKDMLFCKYDDDQRKHAEDSAKMRQRSQSERAALQAAFARDASTIATAQHKGWLSEVGQVYFGFDDNDRKNGTPHQWLTKRYGEGAEQTAMSGLRAFAQSAKPPVLSDAIALEMQSQWRPLHLSYAAGLDILASEADEDFRFTEGQVAGGVVAELFCPIGRVDREEIRAPWLVHALQFSPGQIFSSLRAVVVAQVEAGVRNIHGMGFLLTFPCSAEDRSQVIQSILAAKPENLKGSFLVRVLRSARDIASCHALLLKIAAMVRDDAIAVDDDDRHHWIAAGYLNERSTFLEAMEAVEGLGARVDALHKLLRRTPEERFDETAEILAEVMRLTAKCSPFCENVDEQDEEGRWRRSRVVVALLDQLSADPSADAAVQLARLRDDPDVVTYGDKVRSASSVQRQRQIDSAHRVPTLEQTIATLSNSAPANATDLWALATDYFRETARQLRTDNANGVEAYWNHPSRADDALPRIEDECRDRLLERVRPKLSQLTITAEPEGRMAEHKRSDMVLYAGMMKLVIELKRDVHPDLWTALTEQLDKCYTIDLACGGHGVFGVFWFGLRNNRMPKPPAGTPMPKSAAELEASLRGMMSPEQARRISVVVFDVSMPNRPVETAKPALSRSRNGRTRQGVRSKAQPR